MRDAPNDQHIEWHERVGQQVMFAMTCTHEGDDFGPKAVCVTCFANTQSIGALIERYAAQAWEAGYTSAVEPESDVRDNPYRTCVLPPEVGDGA